jgi:hypothetical protein
MTRETEFLLATLRGTHTAVPESVNWAALLDLADSHRVLPIFCRNIPSALPEALTTAVRVQWAASAFLASELQGLLREFTLSGLEVLPLKGPLLGQILYGSPALRPSDDLDLLVRPEDFVQAQSLLIHLGFTPAYEPDDYHQTLQRGDTCVELHFAVAPPSSPAMDLEGVWRRARIVEFRGEKARCFANPDLLVYLTLHGVKHEFARLLWVLDVVRALADSDEDDLNQALQTARNIGVEGALLTTCALARYSFDAVLPLPIAAAIERQPAISAQAKLMWEKILAGSANPQTSHQGAGLFVQLEPGARGRWAQRSRLFLPSQQDQLWAQQHNIPSQWMRLLRPLRLLAKHGPAAAWRTVFPRVAIKSRVAKQLSAND